MKGHRNRVVAAALVVLLVASAGLAMAANNQALNWSSDKAPNTEIYEGQVDVAAHDRAEMSSPLQYYDDSGDLQTLPATLNGSIDNPVVWRADQIEDGDLSAFPRKSDEANNTASALDASEWSTGGANASKITVTQTDGDTASGVDSVTIATSSMTTDDVAYAEYTNQSITTDPAKRVALIIGSVNTLDANAEIQIEIEDGDGDVKEVYVNSSKDASAKDVLANATGNGLVYQHKLDDLATDSSSGDGSFDGIQTVRVRIVDADADVTLTGVDVERKSTVVVGEQMKDTDSDDDLETVTVEEITDGGAKAYASLGTMGSLFGDSVVHSLGVKGVEYQASMLDASDVQVEFSEAADYPNFPQKVDLYYRLEVPAQIDLSHSSLTLEDEQAFVADRYNAYEYVEGAGDTAFDDIESWTDVSGKLGEKGTTNEIDGTIQSGTTYAVHQQVLVTDDEASELQQTGGGAGPVQESDGGLLGFLLSVPGIVLSSVGGFVVGKWRGWF